MKGLRQEEMLEEIGVGRTTWSNYENNLTEPSIDGLITISRFFGVTLDELLLSDLEALALKRGEIIPDKSNYKKQKGQPLTVNEPNLNSIMEEIKWLREEMSLLKKELARREKDIKREPE
jgi:transcriptional regulator with XRE-family HTH domain